MFNIVDVSATFLFVEGRALSRGNHLKTVETVETIPDILGYLLLYFSLLICNV